MKIIDRLSGADWRNVFIILVILVIVAGGALSSCTPHNYPSINRHDIRFDPNNEHSYIFSDHRQDSLSHPDRVIPNGFKLGDGIRYDFRIESDTVFVKAHHQINQVKWFDNGLSKGIVISTDENNVFKHKFSSHPHSNGYFVVEMPWRE